MAKALSERQLESYRRDGFLFPLPALSPGEVAQSRATDLYPADRRHCRQRDPRAGSGQAGNFVAEPAPSFDFDPEAVAFHAAMLENNTRILYADAEQRPDYNVPAA